MFRRVIFGACSVFFFLILFLCAGTARAQDAATSTRTITQSGSFVFVNTDCGARGTCSLSRVSFNTEDYVRSIPGEGDNYGTRMTASYETDTVEHLTGYVFVQFIEGCECLSFYDRSTGGLHRLYLNRTHYGVLAPFYHPARAIDSVDTDPAYNTAPGYDRHYFYKWNRVRGLIDWDEMRYFGLMTPPHPELYISDLPNQAFVVNERTWSERAYSISLKLKTCLYRTEDVPVYALPSDTDFAEPIVCYDWTSSYVWNHTTHVFERSAEISPVCAEGTVVLPGRQSRP